MSVIHVDHLHKAYESWKKEPGLLGTVRSLFKREIMMVEAVKNVSFDIKAGEIVGFIGPNGAGKTTTLKMLSGVLWPTSGQATVLGHIPWKREPVFQKQFAIVLGSKNQLWWDLPARDTFLLNKEIYDIPTKEFNERLLELGQVLDIAHLLDIPVRKLSLGERMKCELINALLHQPRVLFLDEPTIGLDLISQKAVREFLKTWNKREGTTIVLTSHTMADVQALCERVIIIDKGLLYYDGKLQNLQERVDDKKILTVTFQGKITKKMLTGFGKILAWDPSRAKLEVPRSELTQITKQILDELPIKDLSIEELPIEEVIRTIFLQNRQ